MLVKVGDLNRRRVVHAVEQQLSPAEHSGSLAAAAAATNGHPSSAMIASQPVTALHAAASHASSSPDGGERLRRAICMRKPACLIMTPEQLHEVPWGSESGGECCAVQSTGFVHANHANRDGDESCQRPSHAWHFV